MLRQGAAQIGVGGKLLQGGKKRVGRERLFGQYPHQPAPFKIGGVFLLVAARALVGKRHEQGGLFQRQQLEQGIRSRPRQHEVRTGVGGGHVRLIRQGHISRPRLPLVAADVHHVE